MDSRHRALPTDWGKSLTAPSDTKRQMGGKEADKRLRLVNLGVPTAFAPLLGVAGGLAWCNRGMSEGSGTIISGRRVGVKAQAAALARVLERL